jgi:hypothetical protein
MSAPHPTAEHDPRTKVDNKLDVTQPGERTICEITRHPIGIIGLYTMSVLFLGFVAVLVFGVLPAITNHNGVVGAIGVIILLLLVIICSAYSLVFTRIYWGNMWVVTSDSVTQITQTSLMDRRSSQLSLEILEDVTVEQKGLLAHIFNYGQLRLETAGEHDKYIFRYCPNPNFYAREILAAHEALKMHQQYRHAAPSTS